MFTHLPMKWLSPIVPRTELNSMLLKHKLSYFSPSHKVIHHWKMQIGFMCLIWQLEKIFVGMDILFSFVRDVCKSQGYLKLYKSTYLQRILQKWNMLHVRLVELYNSIPIFLYFSSCPFFNTASDNKHDVKNASFWVLQMNGQNYTTLHNCVLKKTVNIPKAVQLKFKIFGSEYGNSTSLGLFR